MTIRDPSDGSVRAQPQPLETKALVDEKLEFAPGLPPTSSKADYLARLEESRKWLKEYVRPTING